MTTSISLALVCVLVSGLGAVARPSAFTAGTYALCLAGLAVIAYLESR